MNNLSKKRLNNTEFFCALIMIGAIIAMIAIEIQVSPAITSSTHNYETWQVERTEISSKGALIFSMIFLACTAMLSIVWIEITRFKYRS